METLDFAESDLQSAEKNNMNSERVDFSHTTSGLLFHTFCLKNLSTGDHSAQTAQMTTNFVALYQKAFQSIRVDPGHALTNALYYAH